MVAATVADYGERQADKQEGEAFHRSDPLQQEREQLRGLGTRQFKRWLVEETKLPPRGMEARGLPAALSRRGRRLYREGKVETLDGTLPAFARGVRQRRRNIRGACAEGQYLFVGISGGL
jgi:hypothetical protein